jgi:hypothetical protein
MPELDAKTGPATKNYYKDMINISKESEDPVGMKPRRHGNVSRGLSI